MPNSDVRVAYVILNVVDCVMFIRRNYKRFILDEMCLLCQEKEFDMR